MQHLKIIAVSEENYLVLKKLGNAGDSFNDVITEILKRIRAEVAEQQQFGSKVGAQDQTAAVAAAKANELSSCNIPQEKNMQHG